MCSIDDKNDHKSTFVPLLDYLRNFRVLTDDLAQVTEVVSSSDEVKTSEIDV